MSAPAIRPFSFPGLPSRVEFGAGSRFRVGEALTRAGIGRPLVVTTLRGAGLFAKIEEVTPVPNSGVFMGAREHVPATTVTEARAAVASGAADGVLAIGGGSSIGLAKALAHYDGLQYVAVPTTLAGSEMTSVWGETRAGHKRTARDERVRPKEVVYDPELLASLPVPLTVQSGLNALAHIAEAAYAIDTSPLVQMLAREGAESISLGLDELLDSPNPDRARLLYGAALAGMCLSSAAMSIHHRVCHVLGGALDLPHAATHAIVLPHALAMMLPGSSVADAVLSDAFRTASPENRILEILRDSGAPTALSELGAGHDAVLSLADRVLTELDRSGQDVIAIGLPEIERLLERAWAGQSPMR